VEKQGCSLVRKGHENAVYVTMLHFDNAPME